MTKDTVSQERFEENFIEHLRYFKDRNDAVNGQIEMNFKACSAKDRWLEFTHTVTEAESNPNGVIHGGITAWLLDTAMGMLNLTLLDCGITPTISMQVNYLEPIPTGSTVLVRSFIDRIGNAVSFTHGEIWWGDKLAATSSGTYMRIDYSQKK